MIPRILEHLDKAHGEFSWVELCQKLIPCATLCRWRARAREGEPLLEKAGPKKRQLLDGAGLRQKIQQLPHGRRRTPGTDELYRKWSEFISRRRFQELVAEVRDEKNENMTRITWHRPGTAWAMDTTDYGSRKITPLRDLASKYQITAPLVQAREDGEQIALYLDRAFREQGPPLFLKRDQGSPLNCLAVDAVLERHLVLPLTSPPGYPRYNGSVERSMQDLHRALDREQERARLVETPVPLALQAELATHWMNHRTRRVLGGMTPCQFYHDPERRLRLHRASRRRIFSEIFEQFWQIAQSMPERNRHTLTAAWRLLVEDWLRRQKWITVRAKPQPKVSTHSAGFCSQN